MEDVRANAITPLFSVCSRSSSRGSPLAFVKNMHPLIALLVRMACGERYQSTTREDVLVGTAFLASFPVACTAFFILGRGILDQSLWIIWLFSVGVLLGEVGLWLALVRIRSWLVISLVALVGWSAMWLVWVRGMR
jgi:hypothetical protein